MKNTILPIPLSPYLLPSYKDSNYWVYALECSRILAASRPTLLNFDAEANKADIVWGGVGNIP